jgi:hypothetical protein
MVALGCTEPPSRRIGSTLKRLLSVRLPTSHGKLPNHCCWRLGIATHIIATHKDQLLHHTIRYDSTYPTGLKLAAP